MYVIKDKTGTKELCSVSVRSFMDFGYAPETYKHISGKQ